MLARDIQNWNVGIIIIRCIKIQCRVEYDISKYILRYTTMHYSLHIFSLPIHESRWWPFRFDYFFLISAKLDGVKTYMRMRRVPNHLQVKVIKWFDYLWLTQKCSDEEKAVSCLPGESCFLYISTNWIVSYTFRSLNHSINKRLLRKYILSFRTSNS